MNTKKKNKNRPTWMWQWRKYKAKFMKRYGLHCLDGIYRMRKFGINAMQSDDAIEYLRLMTLFNDVYSDLISLSQYQTSRVNNLFDQFVRDQMIITQNDIWAMWRLFDKVCIIDTNTFNITVFRRQWKPDPLLGTKALKYALYHYMELFECHTLLSICRVSKRMQKIIKIFMNDVIMRGNAIMRKREPFREEVTSNDFDLFCCFSIERKVFTLNKSIKKNKKSRRYYESITVISAHFWPTLKLMKEDRNHVYDSVQIKHELRKHKIGKIKRLCDGYRKEQLIFVVREDNGSRTLVKVEYPAEKSRKWCDVICYNKFSPINIMDIKDGLFFLHRYDKYRFNIRVHPFARSSSIIHLLPTKGAYFIIHLLQQLILCDHENNQEESNEMSQQIEKELYETCMLQINALRSVRLHSELRQNEKKNILIVTKLLNKRRKLSLPKFFVPLPISTQLSYIILNHIRSDDSYLAVSKLCTRTSSKNVQCIDEFGFGEARVADKNELQIQCVGEWGKLKQKDLGASYLNIPKKTKINSGLCQICKRYWPFVPKWLCMQCRKVVCALHASPHPPFDCIKCWSHNVGSDGYDSNSSIQLVSAVSSRMQDVVWLYDLINEKVICKDSALLINNERQAHVEHMFKFGQMENINTRLRVSTSAQHIITLSNGGKLGVRKVMAGNFDPGYLLIDGCDAEHTRRNNYDGWIGAVHFLLSSFSNPINRFMIKQRIGSQGYYESGHSNKFILSSMITVKKDHMDSLNDPNRKMYQLGLDPSNFNLLQSDDVIGWTRKAGLGILERMDLINEALLELKVIDHKYPFMVFDLLANFKSYTSHHDWGTDECLASNLWDGYAGLIVLIQVECQSKFCNIVCNKTHQNNEFGEFEVKKGQCLVIYNEAASKFKHAFNNKSKLAYFCIQARFVRINELLNKKASALSQKDINLLINYMVFVSDPLTEEPYRCRDSAIISWFEEKFDCNISDICNFDKVLRSKQQYLNGYDIEKDEEEHQTNLIHQYNDETSSFDFDQTDTDDDDFGS